MKKLIYTLVALLILVPVVALACPPQPEKPVCPQGYITVEEAQWVPEQSHQVCTRMGWVHHGFLDWRWECIKHETVIDVTAHWTDPVCRLPEVNNEFTYTADCDGWQVIQTVFVEGEEVGTLVVDEGAWQDKHALEKIDVAGDGYEFTILEPRSCYVCDEHFVQEFNDGWCTIFVREPNIMPGMTRPNDWSQNLFCGCQYAHSDGWSVRMLSSCSDFAEYEYYMSKPEGCGALVCQ